MQDCANGKSISREEQMIWDELECEIENNLEEEIKDGLSVLARRLQILHQRKNRRSSINDAAAALDLCIVIKLGIGCNIHIKDGSLDNDGSSRPYTPYSEPCLKNSNPDRRSSSSTSQFGSSKTSLTMSKRAGITCASRPLRKRSKNGKAVWKYWYFCDIIYHLFFELARNSLVVREFEILISYHVIYITCFRFLTNYLLFRFHLYTKSTHWMS